VQETGDGIAYFEVLNGMGPGGVMKPIIGFNVDVAIEDAGPTVTRMNIRYTDLILQHGGIPVIFPPGVSPEDVEGMVDGFLLIGGDDYRCGIPEGESDPERFVEVLPRRESADLEWARWLVNSDLPVLGICGGLQILCLAAGGSIYGDLESETGTEIKHRVIEKGILPVHAIDWQGELSGCPDSGSFEVNSSHHQSVKDLPQGWRLLGVTEDGIVEACCDAEGRCVGVQWHPELIPDEPLSQSIVRRLIAKASVRQGERFA